jgi:hypothetical protein
MIPTTDPIETTVGPETTQDAHYGTAIGTRTNADS